MKATAGGRVIKQRYEAPEVRRIKLAQGELAVASCKMRTSSMGPTTGCLRSACRTVGS
jgi:hypothetical protein